MDGRNGGGRAQADLLLRHGRVVTMNADRHILLDGAIAIHEGRIVAVGPDREIAAGIAAATTRDLGGAIVHPGLVDAHAHTLFDIIRGLMPDGRDWSVVEVPFLERLTPEQEYLSSLHTCMEMAVNGITVFADTGSAIYLDDAARAIDEVGIRGIPGLMILDVEIDAPMFQDRRYLFSTEESVKRLEGQLQQYPFRAGGRVRCAVGLNGDTSVSDELMRDSVALARAHGAPMIMHMASGFATLPDAEARWGMRAIEHLERIGVLGPHLTLIHMTHLSDREVRLIVESDTRVVHCPAASARRTMGALRAGRFPEIVARGGTVGLGSDGHSGKHDLLRQAYLDAVMFAEIRGVTPVVTAETALEMATLHGAKALGMADEIGSLEVGKRADIVIHRLDHPESWPLFSDPVQNLVYYGGSRTVDIVIVEGEIILDGGRFTRIDEHDAYRRFADASRHLETTLGSPGASTWPHIA